MKKIISLFLVLACAIHVSATEEINPTFSVKQLQSDFDELYQGLKDSHVNLYANLDEASYQKQFEQFQKRIVLPMTRLQAQSLFQEFVALGKIAHARIDFPSAEYQQYRDGGGKAFPVYVKIDNGMWTVSEDYSKHALSEGTQITHINGTSVEAWFLAIEKHISADTSAITASLLEFQLPQYLWLLDRLEDRVSDSFELTVLVGGKSQSFVVDAISRQELEVRMTQKDSESDEEPSQMREFRILDGGIGYLKPGPFYNAENTADVWNNSAFVQFVDSAFQHFLSNRVSKLIIDVRNNPGGTNSFSDPLIAWYATKPFRFASEFLVRSSEHADKSNQKRLAMDPSGADSIKLDQGYRKHPYGTLFNFGLQDSDPRAGKRFEGEVYVLVDRSSYSNAVSLAAITQDYGFGTVIGEATTDFATTYASMENFTLTETGIQVGFPKGHIIRPSGDKEAGPVLPDEVLDTPDLEAAVNFVLK